MPLGREKIKETHPPPTSRRLYLLPGDVTLLLANLAGFYASVIAQNSSAFSSLLANPPRRHRASTSQDVWRPPTVPPCLFHVSGSGATWLLSTHNNKRSGALRGLWKDCET